MRACSCGVAKSGRQCSLSLQMDLFSLPTNRTNAPFPTNSLPLVGHRRERPLVLLSSGCSESTFIMDVILKLLKMHGHEPFPCEYEFTKKVVLCPDA